MSLSTIGWLLVAIVAALARDLGDLQLARAPAVMVLLGLPLCMAGAWGRSWLRIAAIAFLAVDAMALLAFGLGVLL